ncbi:MAG: hypothetical protein Q8Q18_03045 [bacterium]|nr:hypothetical protein [bacterium]
MVEILIALTVVTGAIAVILGVSALVLRLSTMNLKKVQAAFLAEEGIEIARAIRDNGWDLFLQYADDTSYAIVATPAGWYLSSTTTEDVLGGGSREIFFSPVYRDVNDQIADVGYLDEGTRYVEARISVPQASTSSIHIIGGYLSNIHE